MIGYSMIIFMFAALFCLVWKRDGFKEAFEGFSIAGGIIGFVVLAVHLIGEGI